jgi:hypothetical protein
MSGAMCIHIYIIYVYIYKDAAGGAGDVSNVRVPHDSVFYISHAPSKRSRICQETKETGGGKPKKT